MVDAAPNECVELVVGVINRLGIDKEVEVEVASDGKEVVLNIVDFLLFPEDIHVLHLRVGKLIEGFDQLLLKLESVFVLRKVSQALVDEPNVHVCYRVIDMEVVFNVHCVHKLPRVDVKKKAGQHGRRLYQTSLLSALESASVRHPADGPPYLRGLLDVHMSVHTLKGLVQIKGCEPRLRRAKVLRLIHAIVDLILVLVQI